MKKLIGVDVGSYTFDPTNKQITINNVDNIKLEQLLLITNVTSNIMLFNFADPNLCATILDNIITLNYNTTAMTSSDNLQIFIELDEVSKDTHTIIDTLFDLCKCVKQLVLNVSRPAWFDPAQNRLRETAIIESGTITTVSNLNNYQAHLPVVNQNISSWYLSCRSRIS